MISVYLPLITHNNWSPHQKSKVEDIEPIITVSEDIDNCEGTIVNNNSNDDLWLQYIPANIRLSIDDKLAIMEGNKLNKHIDFAQALLKAYFSPIKGLECVLLQYRLEFDYHKKQSRFFISGMTIGWYFQM